MSGLASSDVEVEGSAGEDLEVEEGAARPRIDRQQVEADTGRGELAGGHAVERVHLSVAEVLRRNRDALGEPG